MRVGFLIRGIMLLFRSSRTGCSASDVASAGTNWEAVSFHHAETAIHVDDLGRTGSLFCPISALIVVNILRLNQ